MSAESVRDTPASPTEHDAHKQLGIYLRDHRAGSEAGLSLARRFLDQNRDN